MDETGTEWFSDVSFSDKESFSISDTRGSASGSTDKKMEWWFLSKNYSSKSKGQSGFPISSFPDDASFPILDPRIPASGSVDKKKEGWFCPKPL